MFTVNGEELSFREWPKIARLSREIIVTEKLDGTNAQIIISDDGTQIAAASRTRLITPEDDNFGFAGWVERNREGCPTEFDDTEQASWPVFLKYLDGVEQGIEAQAQLSSKKYTYVLDRPYRSESWEACKNRHSYEQGSNSVTIPTDGAQLGLRPEHRHANGSGGLATRQAAQ